MGVLIFLALFLSFSGYSRATYCICKDGIDPTKLQATIDYACGAGADCRAIHERGGCYSPNTVKAHCDYAANSYFQSKSQAPGSCDFSGTATPTDTLPSTVAAGCIYPTSASQVTPTTTTTSGIPNTTPGTPIGGLTTTTPGSTTTMPSSTTAGGIFSPSGQAPTGIDDMNPSGGLSLLQQYHVNSFSLTLTLFFSGLFVLWG